MTETPDTPPTPGTRWAWDESPTRETVLQALATLPDVHGTPMVTVLDHTIAIPNNEKVKDDRGKDTGEYKTTWKLYVQVAGREAQMWLAVAENDWGVEFVPEENVQESNPPGIIATDPVSVYRESVVIRNADEQVRFRTTGTSKFQGGDYAWEKAETAARGRALGTLGFGVLPGSGIASFEEMQQVVNPTRPVVIEAKPSPTPQDREEWMVRFRERREQLRLARDVELSAANVSLAAHVFKAFDKTLSRIPDDENAEFEWDGLTDGELKLLVQSLEKQLRQLSDDSKVS